MKELLIISVLIFYLLKSRANAEVINMVLTDTEKKVLEHQDIIFAEGKKRGIDPAVIAGAIQQESGGNIYAKREEKDQYGKVWDRSLGLMQLLTGTAKWIYEQSWGNDTGYRNDPNQLYDPEINIALGTAYLAYQYKRYGDIKDAVAAYNAGSCFRNGISCLTQKTGNYTNSKGVASVQTHVSKVIGYARRYREIFSAYQEYQQFDLSKFVL